MDIKEIRAIIDLMKKNDLAVFKIENEGFKLTLKKNQEGQVIVRDAGVAALPVAAASVPVSAGVVESKPAVQQEEVASGKTIDSPMVGTFYSAPSPESPEYVNVGDKVTADSVVCIIEAMKVMNEIKAEQSGTIVEILAENGKPVQFGQPLFRIK